MAESITHFVMDLFIVAGVGYVTYATAQGERTAGRDMRCVTGTDACDVGNPTASVRLTAPAAHLVRLE